MKDSLILEGKNYISARRAAKIINYAQDYIGQLCRTGKLDCKMVGRSWFVTEESLFAHRQSAVNATEERVAKNTKDQQKDTKVIVTKEFTPSPYVKVIENIPTFIPEIPVAPIAIPVTPVATPIAQIIPEAVIPQIIKEIPAVVEKVEEKKKVDLNDEKWKKIQINKEIKYEQTTGSFLPELRKRVPANFAVSRSLQESIPTSYYSDTRTSASTLNPMFAILIVAMIAVSGFVFTASLTYNSRLNTSKNLQASLITTAEGIVDAVLNSFYRVSNHLALYFINDAPKNSVINTAVQNPETPASQFNGIGIVPSTSGAADELEKEKIRNSFSDEITIHPDPSGTAGVITPVFKKGTGDDFVYVLVPVKDKLQDKVEVKQSNQKNQQ